MDYIKQLLNDIKQGKNISLIITIVLAVSIPILKYFIPTIDKNIPSLTLAVLALLANGLLTNRYQMEKVARSGFHDIYDGYPNEKINTILENSKKEISFLC